MKKLLFTLILLVYSSVSFSQEYVYLSKEKLKKKLQNYNNTYKGGGARITETDSSVHFILRDSLFQPLDIDVFFDKTGESYKEVYRYQCDSCYHKMMNNILKKPFFRWINVRDDIYITRQPKQYIFFQKETTPFSYSIQALSISNKEFEHLKLLTKQNIY